MLTDKVLIELDGACIRCDDPFSTAVRFRIDESFRDALIVSNLSNSDISSDTPLLPVKTSYESLVSITGNIGFDTQIHFFVI